MCGLVETTCPLVSDFLVKKTITCRNDCLLNYRAVEFHNNPVILTPQDISMKYAVPVYYSYNAKSY